MSDSKHPDGATMILIMGILGLVICAPLAIVAWIQGNTYMQACRDMGVEPEGTAVAGRICGIIGSVLMIIGVALFVLSLIAGVALSA